MADVLRMSTTSTSGGANAAKMDDQVSAAYHQQVDRLIASSSTQSFNIARLREKFLDKALKDITINQNGQGVPDMGLSDPSNPLLVEQEVNTQKDYFRKLKFKFLEQDAKLEFLAAISGDEPKVLQMGENEEKERINSEKKAVLKKMKADIEAVRQETFELSKVVSKEHDALAEELEEVEELSKKIKEIELELARSRSVHPLADRMTTAEADSMLDQQIQRMQDLESDLQELNKQVEEEREMVAKVAREVQKLGREKDRDEVRAREAKEGRAKGEVNGVDELCRWYSSATDLYKQILGIRSVSAKDDTELHIEYAVPPQPDTDGEDSVVLVVYFEKGTRKLVDAKLIGHSANIEEAVGVASGGNDVPGLLADVLMRIRPAT